MHVQYRSRNYGLEQQAVVKEKPVIEGACV